MNYKQLWPVLRRTISAWSGHEAPRLGAALAFYSLLSLAPLVILVVSIVGLVFGHTAAQEQIAAQVEGMIGKEGGDTVREMIQHGSRPSEGVTASLIGLATLIFGASGVFGELQAALNRMWDVPEDRDKSMWTKVRERLFSFGMVLSVGFLLLVSLLISAGLASLGKFMGGFLPLPEFVLHLIDLGISVAAISILFALIFKYVPEAPIAWRDVWPGAIVTAAFFTGGKFLIGLYLGKAAVGSAYGTAGSLVVVVVWIYYSAMIFLFGAEFTHVLAQEREMQAEPRAGFEMQTTREIVPSNGDQNDFQAAHQYPKLVIACISVFLTLVLYAGHTGKRRSHN
jgi:membrane protein